MWETNRNVNIFLGINTEFGFFHSEKVKLIPICIGNHAMA